MSKANRTRANYCVVDTANHWSVFIRLSEDLINKCKEHHEFHEPNESGVMMSEEDEQTFWRLILENQVGIALTREFGLKFRRAIEIDYENLVLVPLTEALVVEPVHAIKKLFSEMVHLAIRRPVT